MVYGGCDLIGHIGCVPPPHLLVEYFLMLERLLPSSCKFHLRPNRHLANPLGWIEN